MTVRWTLGCAVAVVVVLSTLPPALASPRESRRLRLVAAQKLYIALQYKVTAQDSPRLRDAAMPPTPADTPTVAGFQIPDVVDETHTKAAFEQVIVAAIAFIAPSLDEGLDLEGKLEALQSNPDSAGMEQLHTF